MKKTKQPSPRAVPSEVDMPVVVYNLIGGGPVKFSDFAKENSLILVINEVNTKPVQYVAAFDCVVAEYMGMLVPVYGQGDTPQAAVANYRNKIKSHTLVIDPSSTFRREVKAPLTWIEDMN